MDLFNQIIPIQYMMKTKKCPFNLTRLKFSYNKPRRLLMKSAALFTLVFSLYLLLVGCQEDRNPLTIKFNSRNNIDHSDPSSNPDPGSEGSAFESDESPWEDADIFVPDDVGTREISETFRGLSFAEEMIITAQYNENEKVNDLCRVGMSEGILYGACFNPLEKTATKCFVDEVFVDEEDRTGSSCKEVYTVLSEHDTFFSCRKMSIDGQTSLYCTDGHSVLAYEYGTLCLVRPGRRDRTMC